MRDGVFICAFALACAVAAPVAAQQPNGGPFGGLFGGNNLGGTNMEGNQSLNFRGSFFEAYDTDVVAEAPGANAGTPFSPSPLPPQAGVAEGASGSLAYAYRRKGTRAQFQFSSTASISGFSDGSVTGNLWIPSFIASTGVGLKLTRKVTLAVNAGAVYAPFYQYTPFLANIQSAEASPGANDYGYAVNSNWVMSESASATLTDQLTKRASLSASVGWGEAESLSAPAAAGQPAGSVPVAIQNFNNETLTASVIFAYRLTQKLGVHGGYVLQDVRLSDQVDAPWSLYHSINLGVDYGDRNSITFARRYTFTFGVGLGVVTSAGSPGLFGSGQTVASGQTVGNAQTQTALVVTGNAALTRSFGRTWFASVAYVRGTQDVLGFTEPLITDTVSLGVSGTIAPRLHFFAGGGYARSTLAFFASAGAISSEYASTMLNYALSRNVGLYAQAADYRYNIPTGETEFVFQSALQRRVVTVGVNFFLPLINQRAHP